VWNDTAPKFTVTTPPQLTAPVAGGEGTARSKRSGALIYFSDIRSAFIATLSRYFSRIVVSGQTRKSPGGNITIRLIGDKVAPYSGLFCA
jgi:hypothetical protein